MFWQGAFWGLTLGTVLGVSRLLIHFGFSRQWNCLQKSNCPSFLCGLHYLYFNLILLGICVLSMLIISLATDPIPDKHVSAVSGVLCAQCQGPRGGCGSPVSSGLCLWILAGPRGGGVACGVWDLGVEQKLSLPLNLEESSAEI